MTESGALKSSVANCSLLEGEMVRCRGRQRDNRHAPGFFPPVMILVAAQRGLEGGEAFAGLQRRWCLGNATFRQEMPERVSVKPGLQNYGTELAELAATQAERIVAEELARADGGWRIWQSGARAMRRKRRWRGACGGRPR